MGYVIVVIDLVTIVSLLLFLIYVQRAVTLES